MKKFLSVMLCMLMLSAMAIPAMAEGEVTVNKYDYTMDESFDSYSTTVTGVSVVNENGNNFIEIKNTSTKLDVPGDSSKAISGANYEAGFKVKLDNAVSKNIHVMVGGSNMNYPVVNTKFVSGSSGTYNLTNHILNKDDERKILIERSEFATGEWNDVRLKITEDNTTHYVTLDVYLNGKFVSSDEYYFANSANANRHPYQFRVYATESMSEGVYFDDMYIAQYTPVTTFTQEVVSASATVGQEVNLPSTVNITTDGVTETVNVLWGDVDTTTAGTKTVYGVMDGYSVDGKAVATVTVTEPKHPYVLAIDGTTLTITKAGTLTPEAKVYGAVYENGVLTDVQILGTVSGSTAWTDNKTTLPLEEGKTYRAFVINTQLVPYAISTELN